MDLLEEGHQYVVLFPLTDRTVDTKLVYEGMKTNLEACGAKIKEVILVPGLTRVQFVDLTHPEGACDR